MGRPGRHRKKGPRKPCGRLLEDKRPDDRIRISLQPHRRGLSKTARLDERAESPLGRLALLGHIAGGQYDAGVRYAVIVGQYRSVIEAPRALGGSGRGFSCCAGSSDDCECYRRRRCYERAYAALMTAGRRAAIAVRQVAVHREEVEIGALRAGLTALARYFGFD